MRIDRLWLDRFVGYEGSTRLVGVLRILCALVIWARWGQFMRPNDQMALPYIAVIVLFWFASSAMLIGLSTRLATATTAAILVFAYFFVGHRLGVDELVAHHTQAHTLFTVWLAFTPCGRSVSVDRWLAVRRATRTASPPPAEHGPLYGQRLVALQVSSMYLWTAYEKSYAGFLSGSRMEQIFMYDVFGSDYPDWPGFGPLMTLSAVLTTGIEWLLPVALWFGRWQRFTLPAAFLLHALIYHGIPVATFTVTMWAMLLAYLDADRFHAWIDRLTEVGR